MKNAKRMSLLSFLLAPLMLASSAPAQPAPKTTADLKTETDQGPRSGDAISAARSQYTQNARAEAISRDADDGVFSAQLSQRRMAPPIPSRRGYARGNYATPWMDQGNAGHAVIGAVIGFGLGAALGVGASAGNRTGTTRAGAALVVGGLGALIGGVIGGSHGGPYPFARHRRIHRPSRAEDSDSDLNADSAGSHSAGRPASAPSGPPQPAS